MNQIYSVLVTGVATGIGQLSTHSLAEAGHTVYASMRAVEGRNAGRARQEREYARAHGVDLRVIEMDVASQESVDQAVQAIAKNHGQIDMVMHNAGHLVLGYTEAFTAEEIKHLFSTNALGVVRVNRAVLPQMRERGKGVLLYTGSTTTVVVPPFMGPYVASKMAMDGRAQTTAYEVSQFGIETCIVMPGAFTQGTEHFPNATGPADAATTAQYGRLDGMIAEYEEATKKLFTPGVNADPQAVADEIVRDCGSACRKTSVSECGRFYRGQCGESQCSALEAPKGLSRTNGVWRARTIGPVMPIETGIMHSISSR